MDEVEIDKTSEKKKDEPVNTFDYTFRSYGKTD